MSICLYTWTKYRLKPLPCLQATLDFNMLRNTCIYVYQGMFVKQAQVVVLIHGRHNLNNNDHIYNASWRQYHVIFAFLLIKLTHTTDHLIVVLNLYHKNEHNFYRESNQWVSTVSYYVVLNAYCSIMVDARLLLQHRCRCRISLPVTSLRQDCLNMLNCQHHFLQWDTLQRGMEDYSASGFASSYA